MSADVGGAYSTDRCSVYVRTPDLLMTVGLLLLSVVVILGFYFMLHIPSCLFT